MGSFIGHFIPGSFFLLFALWWLTQIVRRTIICRDFKVPYYNTQTYPCPVRGRCGTWPIEGCVKILATSIGMTVELLAASDYGHAGGFIFKGDLQHVTMYAFFFIAGVVDVIQSCKGDLLPSGVDYLSSALAFVTEGVLFKYHLHGRPPLDVFLHTVLLYVIAACVIITLLENYKRESVVIATCRIYCVFLQGTWFVQVGFILYNPVYGSVHWDPDANESLLLASMIFAWHLGGVFIVMAIIAGLAYRCYSRGYFQPTRRDIYEQVPLNNIVSIGSPSADSATDTDISDLETSPKSPLLVEAEVSPDFAPLRTTLDHPSPS